MADKQIETCGNFVGGLLESLPLHIRGMVIREIQKLEQHCSHSLEADNPKLSLQLLRLEHVKMVPRLDVEPIRRWKNLPKNHAEAVVNFISNLPLSYRDQALKKITEIVSSFAKLSQNPKTIK